MKYLKKLAQSLTDEKDVATELILVWIAICLTALVIATVLYYIV